MLKSMLPLWLVLGGLAWSTFFQWMRHWPRYRAPGVGTQHLYMIGGLGKASAIGVAVGLVIARYF